MLIKEVEVCIHNLRNCHVAQPDVSKNIGIAIGLLTLLKDKLEKENK